MVSSAIWEKHARVSFSHIRSKLNECEGECNLKSLKNSHASVRFFGLRDHLNHKYKLAGLQKKDSPEMVN
jgi:hypothetical protein